MMCDEERIVGCRYRARTLLLLASCLSLIIEIAGGISVMRALGLLSIRAAKPAQAGSVRRATRSAARAGPRVLILLGLLAAADDIARGQPAATAAQSTPANPPGTEEWMQLTSGVQQAYQAGRFDEAEALATQALALAESRFGRDHPATVASLNNLALVYSMQGHYAQAEPLFARALETNERTLGPNEVVTLISVRNLADLYFSEGRFSEAEPLYLRALSGRERALGEANADTLQSVNDLGALRYSQGRYAEAEPLLRRALEGRERTLGSDQPDTLSSANALAVLYAGRGRYAEAEPLYRRALEGRERTLGADHPDTLDTVNDLAQLYADEGRYAEAEPLFSRVLDGRERMIGRDHPHTLLSMNSLAGVYDAQGRYAEAEALYLRALEASERTLGRDHPTTLLLVNNLATLYHRQGRYAEAEPLALRALETRERRLGRDHPDTLESANNLAGLFSEQGHYAEAEGLYVRVLNARERALGRDDPATLDSVNNLAALYQDQGRHAQAEPLYLRALEARERIMGRDHPDTILAVNNLAVLYDAEGHLDRAEPLFSRALEAAGRVLGSGHPATFLAAMNLASARLGSGTPASAIAPARLAVAYLRARRSDGASNAFAEAQRGREGRDQTIGFSFLADAAWARAAANPRERNALAEESFTALEDFTAGITNRAIVRMAVRHVADSASPGLGALVRERDDLNDQWVSNSRHYGAALAASDGGPLREGLRAERSRIEARLDAIDAILRRDFPQYFVLVRPEALDLATTQAMLAPGEAILMVVPTQFGTHLMAIDHDGIDWVRSDWTRDEINGAVGQLLGNIRVTMGGGRYSYDRQTAFALYQHIVAPVAARLQSKRHVFVVASGSLTSLPFGILVTAAPEGANDDPAALRTTRWFADDHALIAIPSIQSLQFLRRYGRRDASSGPSGGGFVGFGNPLLAGPPGHPEACAQRGGPNAESVATVANGRSTQTGGMLASVSLIRSLCPLPGTAVELESMRAALRAPASVLSTGPRSTEHGFRRMDLSHARILALATHGLVAGEITGSAEPGLVFTPPARATDEDDGYLTASEVAALRLDADWVILSACNTAAGDGSAGAPGLSGLARAFFYAGARNLLASHWPVADDAGGRLTVRTIQLLQGNPRLSRAEALQRAMQEVRNDPNHPEWAHPGVWAPFSLIGDGAH